MREEEEKLCFDILSIYCAARVLLLFDSIDSNDILVGLSKLNSGFGSRPPSEEREIKEVPCLLKSQVPCLLWYAGQITKQQ